MYSYFELAFCTVNSVISGQFRNIYSTIYGHLFFFIFSVIVYLKVNLRGYLVYFNIEAVQILYANLGGYSDYL